MSQTYFFKTIPSTASFSPLSHCCLHLSLPSPVSVLQLHFHLMMQCRKLMFGTYTASYLAILDCTYTMHKARWLSAQILYSLLLRQSSTQSKSRVLTTTLMQSFVVISAQTGALQLSSTIIGEGLQKGRHDTTWYRIFCEILLPHKGFIIS